jgi:hypothetical protein
MINCKKHCENYVTRPGVYCVWTPLHGGGKSPLISIWIDPAMTGFEQRERDENIGLSGINDLTIAEQAEDWPACSAASTWVAV